MAAKNRKKIRRKYRAKNPAMLKNIVSCIKKVPESEKNYFLDDYEREIIKEPGRWAKESPLEEILVIMSKLAIPFTLQMMDDRLPLKAFEIHKATKEFYRRGNLKKLQEAFQKHNYFCLTGREIMKDQSLCSLLVGGSIFKASPDSKFLLKSAIRKDIKNQKAVDDFIENLYFGSEIGELNMTDWKILFFVRRYDDLPVGTLAIHERLSYTVEPNLIQRHLAKLTKRGYLDKWGIKKTMMYALTGKGWATITEAKRKYFEGIRFFDQNESNYIIENQNNGSTSNNRKTEIPITQH